MGLPIRNYVCCSIAVKAVRDLSRTLKWSLVEALADGGPCSHCAKELLHAIQLEAAEFDVIYDLKHRFNFEADESIAKFCELAFSLRAKCDIQIIPSLREIVRAYTGPRILSDGIWKKSRNPIHRNHPELIGNLRSLSLEMDKWVESNKNYHLETEL